MRHRFGRVAVVLALVATAAAAAHQAVTRSRSASASEQGLSRIAGSVFQADAALADLAAAQRAYVAPGQGLDFWANKVDESVAAARGALAGLEAPAAVSRLDDFIAMDRRARDYMGNGQRTLAADLIFADGYEIIAAVRSEASAAAAAARATLAPAVSRDRQMHLASVGVLGACAIFASLLLLRAPKPVEPAVSDFAPVELVLPSQPAPADQEDSIGAALDASLEGLSAPPVAPPPFASAPAVDLSSAAEICVDLARLLDARDLQSVLSRIAGVFNANGVIVWMADRAGNSLSPAVTHGYADSLLARLGPLPLSDDNPTTAAVRTGDMQVVDGALAVPMLTSDGCTGVLALEIRDGKERASDVQSLARIVAAQLAGTISSAATESSETRRAAEA